MAQTNSALAVSGTHHMSFSQSLSSSFCVSGAPFRANCVRPPLIRPVSAASISPVHRAQRYRLTAPGGLRPQHPISVAASASLMPRPPVLHRPSREYAPVLSGAPTLCLCSLVSPVPCAPPPSSAPDIISLAFPLSLLSLSWKVGLSSLIRQTLTVTPRGLIDIR